MTKLTLTPITKFNIESSAPLNANFQAIETAIENTLSRDGTSPNAMQSNLDMNGHAVINVGSLNGVPAAVLNNLSDLSQYFSQQTANAVTSVILASGENYNHHVISGGDWVERDLVTSPSYEISVTSGTGIIGTSIVSWPASTVVTSAANALIVVNSQGVVSAVAAGLPESILASDKLLLFRTYVDVALYGARIYSVLDSRSFTRKTPAKALELKERVEASKITSGAWAGATAVNDIGDINWYFGNIGLYPFVETLPTQVQDHLNVQITKFYANGATGSTNWTSLHGTTWNNFNNWAYDVASPRTTSVAKRADSHDSYAATFCWLAVRYAKYGGAGALTWWDNNVTAIQNALYWNILIRQRLVGGGAGYMTDTFQDVNVYTVNQTLDNIEVYRGTVDALNLMISRGGAQATWATPYLPTAANILQGIEAMWLTSQNTFSVGWNSATSLRETNPLNRFYPDFVIGPPAAIFNVPISATTSISRTRMARLFDLLNANCPNWWRSRRYDVFPWGILVAAAVKRGMRWVGEEWLAFIQRHAANDSQGVLLIHDVGWARYIERLLEGDTTL